MLDLVARAERRGWWHPIEAALYCAQIHAVYVPQNTVDSSTRSRYGEKPPLEGFIVDDIQPVFHVGVTCQSVDEWIESYTPRFSRRNRQPPRRPALTESCADLAERLGITRKLAWRQVYVEGKYPTVLYQTFLYSQWEYPALLVRLEVE